MKRNLIVAGVVASVMAVFILTLVALKGGSDTLVGGGSAMSGGMGANAAHPAGTVPAVKGYLDGQEIRFIHTESSDPQVAEMLTRMMGSPVLVVRSLADLPASSLAPVYVFQNGVKGEGPFGFQPDVFDRPPTRPDYTPLRAVHLVKWKDESKAVVLKSADEVRQAESRGEVRIERPGAVVNMPLLTWPGGQR